MLELINHKLNFPPRPESTEELLKELINRKPKYVFAIEWPEDESMPICHTSTSSMPVLALRLQNFLTDLYSGKYDDKFFIEKE